MSLYSQGIVTVKATVEKAENGYIVDFGTARRVALDELGLAAVFEDWPAPPALIPSCTCRREASRSPPPNATMQFAMAFWWPWIPRCWSSMVVRAWNAPIYLRTMRSPRALRLNRHCAPDTRNLQEASPRSMQ